jgi:hypothetical protein
MKYWTCKVFSVGAFAVVAVAMTVALTAVVNDAIGRNTPLALAAVLAIALQGLLH